jgi:FixJ family two-component response regulator
MKNENRPTVFVVDDDASMREALKNLFRPAQQNLWVDSGSGSRPNV